MTEEKRKVMCLRKWQCGFYSSFEDAQRNNFVFCQLCGNFLLGGKVGGEK